MTFLLESLIACAVFTLFVFLMSRNPIKSIFNYPPAIIERCDKLGLVDAGNRPGGQRFDALVLDCIWFCHDKHFVIPGTEDMTAAYHDYWFHIKGSLIGMALGIPSALVAGLIVMIL